MAIELETAEIQIDTIGVEAAMQALDALTGDRGQFEIGQVETPEPSPPAPPAAAQEPSIAPQPEQPQESIVRDTGAPAEHVRPWRPDPETAPLFDALDSAREPPADRPPTAEPARDFQPPQFSVPREVLPGEGPRQALPASQSAAAPPISVDLSSIAAAQERTNDLLSQILAALEARPVTQLPTY